MVVVLALPGAGRLNAGSTLLAKEGAQVVVEKVEQDIAIALGNDLVAQSREVVRSAGV